MGSHAKPRTPGRKTAIGALALGATLTGVGLTAAALDPATAVLTASGTDDGGSTQLSGLSDPVGLSLSPAADDITNLTSAPLGLGGLASATNGVNGTASGALESAGGLTRTITSGTLDISTKAPGTQNAIKPIAASALTASRSAGGSYTGGTAPSTASSTGYTGKHAKTRSAPAPAAASTPLASSATSGLASSAGAVLPLAQGLLAKVPVVSSLVQGTGLTGTAGGVLGTAAGTVGGTVNGTSGDPASGVVGSLPVVGTLLGGSGDGQSTLSVPNVSTLTGSLGGLV